MAFSSYVAVAKRTRSKKALFLRECERREKSNNGSGMGGLSECSGSRSENSLADRVRVRDSEELDSGKVRGSKDASRGQNFVVPNHDNDEDEVVELRYSSNSRFGKTKNVVIIADSDDDDVEGEEKEEREREKERERGFHSGSLDSSRLKRRSVGEAEREKCFDLGSSKGSRSKKRSVGGDQRERGLHSGDLDGSRVMRRTAKKLVRKAENEVPIVVDESESSDRETEKESEESFKFNGNEKFWVARTPLKLGFHNQHKKPASIASSESNSESSSSSDDVGDNSDDEDFAIDGAQCSLSEEESTSCSKDGDGHGDGDDIEIEKVEKRGSFVVEVEDVSVEKRLKRRRVCGLDILSPPKWDKGRSITSTSYNCVAQRTRSHFNSRSSEKKTTKNNNLGTVSRPEEIDSSAESDRDDDSDDDDLEVVVDDDENNNDNADENNNSNADVNNNDNADDHIQKEVVGKDEGELGKPTKRKRVRAPKIDSLFKLFVDTIWEKGEQESTHSDDEAAEQETNPSETLLPLKFSFGVEKPKPKEKSDFEKELYQLWAEFDFAQSLRSIGIGSFGPATVDAEKDAEERGVEADPSTFCQLGKHELILDEQIGIRCRFCSFVKLEIKFILPSFSTSCPWDRASKKIASADGEFSMFDGFNFQDKDDLQGSYVHTTGTVWDKFPGIRKKMFPHQQDGFEFLWRNIAGGIDLDIKNSNSSNDVGGCVISHAPGTGKTFLTIVFLRTYMEIFKECRPVIIAPCSMLLTWEEEFKKWKVDIPFHNLNSGEFSGKEDSLARELVQNRPQSMKWKRIVKLVSWSRGKSILGVSYPLFEKLAGERSVEEREGKKEREILSDKESEEIRKILLEKPSLLVLDEGHTPRNTRSRIWKALKNVKAERRIILSGTPFQNNFEELYNTLWLARPKFADRISCKTQGNHGRQSKLPENEESRGKWATLTNPIGKKTDDRLLKEVRKMIDPFVHVYAGSILQQNLPGLRETLVVLHPPPLQKQLLEEVQGIKNSFKLEHEVVLVSVHPSLLEKCDLSGKGKLLIDMNPQITSERFKLDPNEGVKTRFLMELMKLSDVMNEKVLVFSQYIDPFPLIKDQLRSLFNWTEGEEVLQMDGKQDLKVRQSLINRFNHPASKVKVLLASTKACCEGINLIGASRIVLLDQQWNPSVERQAISRAYRLGQTKVVYTYHLIASGTMEEAKFCRQVHKDHLSKLVFPTEHGLTENPNNSSTMSDDRILDALVGHEKLKDMFDNIIYEPNESNLIETFGSMTSKQT